MAYGLDLRQKVIDYIENGGRVTKAAEVFGIGRASIYRWLSRKELEATKVKYRQHLNDMEHDFSALKRARMYAPSNTPLDEIIRNYCVA